MGELEEKTSVHARDAREYVELVDLVSKQELEDEEFARKLQQEADEEYKAFQQSRLQPPTTRGEKQKEKTVRGNIEKGQKSLEESFSKMSSESPSRVRIIKLESSPRISP